MYAKQLIRKKNLLIGDFRCKGENTLKVYVCVSLSVSNMIHTSVFMCVCMRAGKCICMCVCVCVLMGAPVVMKGALHMTYHHPCMCVSGYRREDSEQYLVPNYACGGCGYKVLRPLSHDT